MLTDLEKHYVREHASLHRVSVTAAHCFIMFGKHRSWLRDGQRGNRSNDPCWSRRSEDVNAPKCAEIRCRGEPHTRQAGQFHGPTEGLRNGRAYEASVILVRNVG